MGVVFINYRRENTAGEARALYGDLGRLLGEDRVFMDVDNIELGHDFRDILRDRLAHCEVMLTLIGRGWRLVAALAAGRAAAGATGRRPGSRSRIGPARGDDRGRGAFGPGRAGGCVRAAAAALEQVSPAPAPAPVPAPAPAPAAVPARMPAPAPAAVTEAVDALVRRYARGFAPINNANFRSGLLRYLNATDPKRWTEAQRTSASATVQRLRQAMEAGRWRPRPEVRTEFDRLAAALGA